MELKTDVWWVKYNVEHLVRDVSKAGQTTTIRPQDSLYMGFYNMASAHNSESISDFFTKMRRLPQVAGDKQLQIDAAILNQVNADYRKYVEQYAAMHDEETRIKQGNSAARDKLERLRVLHDKLHDDIYGGLTNALAGLHNVEDLLQKHIDGMYYYMQKKQTVIHRHMYRRKVKYTAGRILQVIRLKYLRYYLDVLF